MDKSGAEQAAPEQSNRESEVPITIRQVKHLNNIVGQDHRAIKRITLPMLGFTSFQAARAVLAGIEPQTAHDRASYNEGFALCANF